MKMDNNENNITNINEYRGNKMPGVSGFDINNPSQNLQMGGNADYSAESYVEEFVSEEFVNAYLEAVNQTTPDLWSRIESGFEVEARDIINERRRKSKRVWKTVGYVAAAALITVIAIPVMKLSLGGEKSEEMIYKSTTNAVNEQYNEESGDMLDMEAVQEDVAMESESMMEDTQCEAVTEAAPEADGVSNNQVTGNSTQLKEIQGVQTDSRQLVVKGKFVFDDDTDIVKFNINVIEDNAYGDITIEIGDEITLSNPMYVLTMDFFVVETEITLDSIELDEAGNIMGRIVDLDLQGWDVDKENIEE